MRRTRTSVIAGIVAAIVVLAAVPAAFAALHSTAVPPTCTRDQLGVKLHDTQGALGTIYGAWLFTNHSATSCSLNGYPDLQLYGRTGRPLSTTVHDSLAPAPTDVTLAPAGSATFLSSYSDVQNGTQPCRTSEVLQVTPPSVTGSLFIPAELMACGGVINVSAVEAGVHHA